MMWERSGFGMARLISTVMLLIVTLVVGILFYRVMVGFFVPLFLAALLVVIFRPVHEWIVQRMGGRPRLAALVTTAAILLVVLLPAVLVIGIAAAQGTSLVSRVNYNSVALAIERTREQLGLEIEHIDPFVRMPQLVQSLGEIESLTDARQVRQAQSRLREFEQVLRTLQQDHAPLTPMQEAALEATRRELAELGEDMAALVDDSPTDESPESVPPDSPPLQPSPPVADEPPILELSSDADFSGADPPSLTDEDGEGRVDFRSPAERYQRSLVGLDVASHELAAALLGGNLRAQLKMLANPTDEEIDLIIGRVRTYLQPRILWFTGATGEFLLQGIIGFAILIIALYFFLVDGPAMVRTLMRLSPLDDLYEHKLLVEFDRTSRAVVLATVLSALAQGVLATVGYSVAGLGSIVLLFLLTSFMSLIPFLGAASVWIPCAVWLGLVEERWGAAIALALYGALVVSSLDNLIKVFVLHGRSQLHPLLALLSVLGGVQVFGPIGILVGPMVVVFLQTTLEILNHELSRYAPGEAAGEGDLAMAIDGDAKVVTRDAAPPAQNETDE